MDNDLRTPPCTRAEFELTASTSPGKGIKQKTTETLEKLASTKMNKEKTQLCHTGAQRAATAATRYTCAHTRTLTHWTIINSFRKLTNPDYSCNSFVHVSSN